MSLNTLSIAIGGTSRPCLHVRQHHPGAPELFLPCAWPDCEVGVGQERLSLAGAEKVFIWHPCVGAEQA